MVLPAVKDEVRILIRKSIQSGSRRGLSLSYLNSYLLVYLREMLGAREFSNAVLLVAKPLATLFFEQIYGDKHEWISDYSKLTQARRFSEKPAVAVLGGNAVSTLADTLRIAESNGRQCVIALLADFKTLIEHLRGVNCHLLPNYLLVVDACKCDFSSRRREVLEEKGWNSYVFKGDNFDSLVALIQQAKNSLSSEKPAVIFVRSQFNQILI